MESREIEGKTSFSSIKGMDLSADWLLGPGRELFTRGDDQALIPFMFTPLDQEALSVFDRLVHEQLGHTAQDQYGPAKPMLVIPNSDRDKLRPGQTVVLFARLAFFDTLLMPGELFNQFRDANKLITLGPPLKQISLPDDSSPQPVDPPLPSPKLPADTVIVGVIDDGIAFGHERFQWPDGTTRVQYYWRQDGPLDNVTTVAFGREIWKADLDSAHLGIDSLLKAHTVGGLVDEEALYRDAKLVDFGLPDHKAAAWNLAHGTHVLDLAAGYGPASAPLNIAIIAVQLPVAATADTSWATLDNFVLKAIDYILARADLLAGGRKRFPVIINFSYGHFAGPHDGTSQLELAIDKLIADRPEPLSVVLPSGNGHLSRCHAEITFDKLDDVKQLAWRIQPEDMAGNSVQIWTPYDDGNPPAQSRLTIRIKMPSGLLSALIDEKSVGPIPLMNDAGIIVGQAKYQFMFGPTARGVFSIFTYPTSLDYPPGPGSVVAPSGTWKIYVSNVSLTERQRVLAWIERNDTIYGYPQRGRQSYFDRSSYTRFDPTTGGFVELDHEEDANIPPSAVKRRRMINAIATGTKTTVVGGVFGKELSPAPYSAGGPVTPARGGAPSRDGPDLLTVSDDSKVHIGVIAAGTRSGSAAVMNGTSVAAPQITRLTAQLASASMAADRVAIRVIAAAEEAASPAWPPIGSKIRAGEGRIIIARPDRLPRLDPGP